MFTDPPQTPLFTRIGKTKNIPWSSIKTNPNYKCNTCDVCFVDEELLERHIRIMHEQTKTEKISKTKQFILPKPNPLSSEIKSEMVLSHLVQSDDGQIIDTIQGKNYMP